MRNRVAGSSDGREVEKVGCPRAAAARAEDREGQHARPEALRLSIRPFMTHPSRVRAPRPRCPAPTRAREARNARRRAERAGASGADRAAVAETSWMPSPMRIAQRAGRRNKGPHPDTGLPGRGRIRDPAMAQHRRCSESDGRRVRRTRGDARAIERGRWCRSKKIRWGRSRSASIAAAGVSIMMPIGGRAPPPASATHSATSERTRRAPLARSPSAKDEGRARAARAQDRGELREPQVGSHRLARRAMPARDVSRGSGGTDRLSPPTSSVEDVEGPAGERRGDLWYAAACSRGRRSPVDRGARAQQPAASAPRGDARRASSSVAMWGFTVMRTPSSVAHGAPVAAGRARFARALARRSRPASRSAAGDDIEQPRSASSTSGVASAGEDRRACRDEHGMPLADAMIASRRGAAARGRSASGRVERHQLGRQEVVGEQDRARWKVARRHRGAPPSTRRWFRGRAGSGARSACARRQARQALQ